MDATASAAVERHARILDEQRVLWSANPPDWAELAEPENRPLYEAMLDAAIANVDGEGGLWGRPQPVASTPAGRVEPPTERVESPVGRVGLPTGRIGLLDLACGSGLLLRLATDRGLAVAGIDLTPELLTIARTRTPEADLRVGDISELPFPDASVTIVTGANAFQFAPDPALAFSEAARVLAPGGVCVAASFAEPERNEGTVLHLAMKALAGESEDQYAPYALSDPDGLAGALSEAGLDPVGTTEVPLSWHYPDLDSTVRALLASAGGARAARAAGRDAVVAAISGAAVAMTQTDGSVLMHNVFRYAIGRKPA